MVEGFEERIARINAYYALSAPEQIARSAARSYTRAFDAFCALLPEGGVVLDIGCGGGNHLDEFAKRGLRAIGMDPSSEMRDLACERGHEVIEGSFETLDQTRLPTIDGVWSVASLLHVPFGDVPEALGAVARKFGAGGALFLGVLSGGRSASWERWDESAADLSAYVQLLDESELLAALTQVGFATRDTWREESTWIQPSYWLSIVCTLERPTPR